MHVYVIFYQVITRQAVPCRSICAFTVANYEDAQTVEMRDVQIGDVRCEKRNKRNQQKHISAASLQINAIGSDVIRTGFFPLRLLERFVASESCEVGSRISILPPPAS